MRPLGPTNDAFPLATTVVGLTNRPDQIVVTLQSDVQFLEVLNTTNIGTCAQAVCEGKIFTCPDVATEARFDAAWRSLCIGLGIHSVQSAPVFSFDGKPLGTFVVAARQSQASFDMEMTGFGVYAMRTILSKMK